MKRVVLLTKTRWDEPPRLRHQLAQLLADAGYEIIFFEKPQPFWRRPPSPRKVHDRITLVGYRELLHHKLRLFPLLHRLNARVALRSLRTGLRALGVADPAVVINFNYEYYFVDDITPGCRAVTVINDDHTATALFGWRRPLEWALRRTCQASAQVLTVSQPLVEALLEWCDPILFRPWSDAPYTPPVHGERDTILYWGYVNERVDFAMLGAIADSSPRVHVLIVGPVEKSAKQQLAQLLLQSNIEWLTPRPLDQLPLDRVFAGLLPYRADRRGVRAADLPNKALQLLARGLPLLVSGMPRFLDRPFVRRLDVGEAPDSVLNDVQSQFHAMQGSIEEFVDEHSAAVRLRQLKEIISA